MIVARRRAGSVKCIKCLQVCGKKHLRAANDVHAVTSERCSVHPAAAWVATSRPAAVQR